VVLGFRPGSSGNKTTKGMSSANNLIWRRKLNDIEGSQMVWSSEEGREN